MDDFSYAIINRLKTQCVVKKYIIEKLKYKLVSK